MSRVVLVLSAAAVVVLAGTTLGVGKPHAGLQATERPVSAARGVGRAEVAAEFERQMLIELNDVRRDHGLVALRLNTGLVSAAREHSFSMADHGFFGHQSWDGSTFWKRVRPLYPPFRGRLWAAGENLVWGSPGLTARAALEMWLNRSQHRKNLLNVMWRDVGLGGVRADAASGVYKGLDIMILTADFGVR